MFHSFVHKNGLEIVFITLRSILTLNSLEKSFFCVNNDILLLLGSR